MMELIRSAYDWWIAKLRAIRHSKPPEPPMRLRLHEAGHAVVGYRFGYTQQGIMLREDDTGETSQQYATGMDDDMSVRLQTETIISMAGFAVTLEYPEIPDRRAPHRRRRAVGTGERGDHPPYRPGDGLHRRDHGLIVGQGAARGKEQQAPDSGGRRKARPLRFLDRRGRPANHRRMRKGAGPLNILEWPADLTDFRLPPAWDGRPVDWHGWHQPIEARALFPCENNGLRRDPQPCSGCGHPFQPWWAQGLTADGRTSITVERCGFCNTTIAFETGPDGTSEWTLDDSDYGPEGSFDNQKGNR